MGGSNMVNNDLMSYCVKDCLNMKINHGPILYWDKDCLSMKINNSKPWSTIFILRFIIFILGFLYLGFIIFIPWVFNINPLDLLI